jgi:sugar/nucleoside kinase (ribokinase family)
MASVPLTALTQPGHLYEVDAMDVSTGGAVSNTGLALHRLGVNVRLLSSVGDDLIGRLIVDFLKSRDPGLAQFIAPVGGVSSSYSIVLSPQRVDRIFLHNPGTNATFGANSIDYSVVERVRVVHLGYPPILPRLYANDGQELVEMFERLKARGVVTSLDMSLPDTSSPAGSANWGKILQSVLPYVDIFVPSLEEIMFMLRRADYDASRGDVRNYIRQKYVKDITNEILGMGAAIAGVKCGVDGIVVSTADSKRLGAVRQNLYLPTDWNSSSEMHPSFHVDVVGTTGAGDSAYAGFLAAMIRGTSIAEAVRLSCAVGACNVEAADATSGVLDWDSTLRRMNSGWRTNPSRLLA